MVIRIIDKYAFVIEGINKRVAFVAAVLCVPMVMVIVYDVFCRYFLYRTTLWAYDITYMLNASIYLLGAAFVLSKGAHLRFDVFYINFSPKVQAIINVFGYLLIFLPAVSLIAYSTSLKAIQSIVEMEYSTFTPMPLVVWPLRVVIAISFILLSLQGVAELLKAIKKLIAGKSTKEIVS